MKIRPPGVHPKPSEAAFEELELGTSQKSSMTLNFKAYASALSFKLSEILGDGKMSQV